MRVLSTLLFTFFDICRLRLGPQNIPYSLLLLSLTIFCYMMVGVILASIELALSDAILFSVVETTASAIIISSLLYVTYKSSRLYQTLTALTGIDTLFGTVRFPLVYWISLLPSTDSLIALFLFSSLLILIMWNLLVYAHILRNTLEVSLGIGVALTVVSSLLTTSILYQIFPMLVE